jgi:hypothetical protein
MNTSLLTALSSLAAMLVSIGALYIAWKKAPAERESIEVDTASKYQIIADKAAERALKLDERVNELEDQLVEKDKEIADLRLGYTQLKQENMDLRDWAERLAYQVQSQGLVPVKMRTMRTNE